MHPREAKLNLAEYIVTQYHGKEAAKKARDEFEKTCKLKRYLRMKRNAF